MIVVISVVPLCFMWVQSTDTVPFMDMALDTINSRAVSKVTGPGPELELELDLGLDKRTMVPTLKGARL
jgi:hypothetical protein